jgi:tungstate transport system ATP-binding protein
LPSCLEARDISKKYDGSVVLDHVNLKANASRITSIVGVNGAGKTTLLKILAGLEETNDGCILIDSNEIPVDALRNRSTMIFQKSVMIGGTVYDNVAYGLRVNRVPSQHRKEKVRDALDAVNLANFEKRKARKLSSGEQQRVAIARALVIEREILLIDEPTANLDPANTMIIEQAIKSAARSRILILSTHNLPQAKRLSHQVIHLYKGSVIEDRDAEDFFTRPRDEKTRLFVDGELQG